MPIGLSVINPRMSTLVHGPITFLREDAQMSNAKAGTGDSKTSGETLFLFLFCALRSFEAIRSLFLRLKFLFFLRKKPCITCYFTYLYQVKQDSLTELFASGALKHDFSFVSQVKGYSNNGSVLC